MFSARSALSMAALGAIAGYAVGSAPMIRLRRDLEDARHQAEHDPLTGLWNRAAGYRVLSLAAVGAAATCVVLVDVNEFKRVNDLHGHRVGDRVLRYVADQLTATVGTGTVSRIGGDEFLLVIPGDLAHGVALTHRAVDRVRAAALQVDDRSIPVSVSAGVVGSDAPHPAPDLLVCYADIAMYTAKLRGGGVRVYHPELADGLRATSANHDGPDLPSRPAIACT
jgi:diguanylate cyclase (GGDEF)-like protein